MKGIADTTLAEAPPPQPRADGSVLARGPFVRVMTVLIVALVLSMSALIYRQSVKFPEPSSAIYVQGNSTLDGAKLVVTGNEHRWTVILNGENKFATPVLVEPGHYSVVVTRG